MKSIKCRYLNNAELADRKKTFFLERWTAKIIHVFTMHVHFSGQYAMYNLTAALS